MYRSAGAERKPPSRAGVGAALCLALAMTLSVTLVAASAEDHAPTLPAGPTPPGVTAPLAPASNATDEAKVALGRLLFTETKLSANGKLSCAQCHVTELGLADGVARSIGILHTPIRRNAPSLLNAALLPRLFWDGRVESLEEQARLPITAKDELGMTEESAAAAIAAAPEYPPLFEKAFGDKVVTLQRIARALAAFQRTLISGDAPFDRWWRGDQSAIDDSAKRGYSLFIDRAGCSQCHSLRQSYALFTDNDFHITGAGAEPPPLAVDPNYGKADLGRYEVTKRDEDRHAFRTPSLRNVAITGPYMHDGSLGTLEEVVEFYVKGGGEIAQRSKLMHALTLTTEERADLVSFMRSLTSTVLPKLDACEKLLREGRPREAFELFRRELDERAGGDRALTGLASAALAIGDDDTSRAAALADAETRIRRRLRDLGAASADTANANTTNRDGEGAAPDLLTLLGRLSLALAPLEDAMAQSRQDDALVAWRRVRAAVGLRDDAASAEAALLERLGRGNEALDLLAAAATPTLRELRAQIEYRTGWRRLLADRKDEAGLRDVTAAADAFDALAAAEVTLSDESMLFRAAARHWTGDVERARERYLAAARKEAIAEKALRGLRSLLVADLPRYRADLAKLRDSNPNSPTFAFFAAFEDLEAGRLDEAERGFRRRMEIEAAPTAGPHVYLARIAVRRADRTTALAQYATAFALDGRFPGLAAEYEGVIRAAPISNWADVDRYVAEYRTYLGAGPDDISFQIRIRNNIAFALRDIAAAWTSRGPARLHTFAVGAPDKAKETLRLSLRFYEESAAFVPDDATDLPFKERWLYAGVLNDLGLMLHYFPEIQDLPRAERCYLRAFELTDGAYQDAYFYNLQFLYGFELNGRAEKWWELSKIAKDAILAEDPASPSGFSPDLMKRGAARRDFDRLSSELGR